MPFAYPFVLTTIEGFFGTNPGEDIWRTTFKIPVDAGEIPAPSDVLEFCNAIAPDVQNYCASSDTALGSFTYLEGIAGAVVGTDGRYLGGGSQVTQRYTYGSPVPGTGSAVHPFDAALCLSLKGAVARGRGSRGRMYFPARAMAIEAGTGKISSSSQFNAASQGKTLIDALNGHAATVFGPARYVSVMSNLGTGTISTVVAVSVGRLLDHMSSRTSKQDEGHDWIDLASTFTAREAEEERVTRLMRAGR